MVKLIIYIVFILVVFMTFYIVNKGVVRAAYDQRARYCQIREIVVFLVLIFATTNRYTFSGYLFISGAIINSKVLSHFWSIVMPEREYVMVYLVLSFLLTNLLFLIATCIVLTVVKYLINSTTKINFSEQEGLNKLLHLPWIMNDIFYGIDDETERYQVTNRGFTISIWAKWMKYAFLIIGLGEIVFFSIGMFRSTQFIVDNAMNMAKAWYLLPIVGFLFLEQIQIYLGGVLEFKSDSLHSAKIDGKIHGDLKVLCDCFGRDYNNTNALLSEFVQTNMESPNRVVSSNELTTVQKKQCSQPELLQMIINQIKHNVRRVSEAYQNAVAELLNGKSVHICDYLEGEILPYISAYISYYVSQRKSFLILCSDSVQSRRVKESVNKMLSEINQLDGIWTVCDADELLSNHRTNILVCTWDDLLQKELSKLKPAFFKVLKGVIISDGKPFCSLSNPHKNFLFSELKRHSENVQYIIINNSDNPMLRTAFEYYARDELIPFKNDHMPKEVHVMIWAEESKYKIQRYLGISGDTSPYIGVAIPLSLTALKYGVNNVSVYGDGSQSFFSEFENMKNAGKEIRKYVGHQKRLENRINYNPIIEEGNENLSVQIIFDREMNILPTLTSWIKYGGSDGALVHIISPAYMLRELFTYRIANGEIYSGEFDPIINYESGLKRSVLLEMLLKIANVGMTDVQIRDLYERNGLEFVSIKSSLEESMSEVLQDREIYSVYESFLFETYSTFNSSISDVVEETRITLRDEEIRTRIKKQFANAKLISKDIVYDYVSIPVGEVTNHYLPGQNVSINGRQYQIAKITEDTIFAEQFDIGERKQYYQCSEFILDLDMDTKEECEDMDLIDYNIYHANATRQVHGYWESNTGIDFAKPNSMQLRQINTSDELSDVLVMEISIHKSHFGERSREAITLMGFMLQEIIKTLYPYNYMDLFVSVKMDVPERFWDEIKSRGCDDPGRGIFSVLPFIRTQDYDNDEHVKLYIIEFTRLEKGMIRGLYRAKDRVFSMMKTYLEWYLSEETANAGKYLNLGCDSIPSCFAAEELLSYLVEMQPHYAEMEDSEEETIISGDGEHCSYCGAWVPVYEKLDDGRIMCANCSMERVEQEEEILEIYTNTIDEIKGYYRISIQKGISIRMKSAESIRRKAKTSNQRLLGFFDNNNQELWIESRGPRNSVRSTIVHELVHAWQYDNLDQKKLQKMDSFTRQCLLEGHAVFVEIDAMRQYGETDYSEYLEKMFSADSTEYGVGFRVFRIKMTESSDRGSDWTPFSAAKELLDDPSELRQLIDRAKHSE